MTSYRNTNFKPVLKSAAASLVIVLACVAVLVAITGCSAAQTGGVPYIGQDGKQHIYHSDRLDGRTGHTFKSLCDLCRPEILKQHWHH